MNFKNPYLWLCVIHIMFNVLYWNVTSTIQYKTKFFTKLFGKKLAIYLHSISIFLQGLSRNFLFKYVCETSNKYEPLLDNQLVTILAYLILTVGVILVSTSTLRLGIIGTYNGDAYGYLMSGIVTSFPYNFFDAPMYFGSTLNFLYCAVLNRSIVGLVLSAFVGVVYYTGTIFEDKLTSKIYSDAARLSTKGNESEYLKSAKRGNQRAKRSL